MTRRRLFGLLSGVLVAGAAPTRSHVNPELERRLEAAIQAAKRLSTPSSYSIRLITKQEMDEFRQFQAWKRAYRDVLRERQQRDLPLPDPIRTQS